MISLAQLRHCPNVFIFLVVIVVVLCSYAASVSCKAQAVLNDFTNEQNNGQQNTANAVCVLKVYGVNMEILLLSVYTPLCTHMKTSTVFIITAAHNTLHCLI